MPKCGQKTVISKSKGSKMLSGPLSIPIFQNNFSFQNCKCITICVRKVLQIAKTDDNYKMLKPLLQNAQVITKSRNPYHKKVRKLLQNASLLQNVAEQCFYCGVAVFQLNLKEFCVLKVEVFSMS